MTDNRYSDGTIVRRGDVVLADDGGQYVVVDPTYSDGFVFLAHIKNPTRFKRKARTDTCKKLKPDKLERERAAEALARVEAPKKRSKPRRAVRKPR